MKKTNYNAISTADLLDIAEENEVKVPEGIERKDLISLLKKEIDGDKENNVSAKPRVKSSSKIARLKADLFRQEYVSIVDNSDLQTKIETETFSFSNRLIPLTTIVLPVDGTPVYAPRWALMVAEQVEFPKHVSIKNTKGQDDGAKQVWRPRYTISRLSPLTESEIKDLAEAQRIRKKELM